jgi:imidazole glycerol-phosphate synthase subunit HisH
MKIDAILIDAGTGNLHSVRNALEALGYAIHVTADPADLLEPARVVLPGVGAFASFMEGLSQCNLVEPLREVVRRGDPLLGICVGMQAFFEGSEELGNWQGLGLLPGRVMRFPHLPCVKIPHTGWNQLWFSRPSPLFTGLESGAYTYFNHSYYCGAQSEHILATTDYGLDFASAVQKDNLYGVQFHPEKSQRVGQTILRNFFQL